MRLTWLFALVMLPACAAADVQAPRVLRHQTSPAGPLVHTLQVELDRPSALRVEYWTENAPRLTIESGATATHSIPLTRLRANRAYQYRIGGTEARGAFVTEPLPPDLEGVRLTASGSPTIPLALLHLYDPVGFRGYAAVDAAGEVVWYWRTADMALGAARRATGGVVFLDRGRGLVEVRPDGSVVHELPQDPINREQHHDVIVTPRDTLLFLAFEPGQHAGRLLKGEAIWEWTPETGQAVKRWSSWDHFSPRPPRPDWGPRSGVENEWLHANSLALGPRENVLVSFHFLNQVVSISPDFQRVEWRLGGVNATRQLATADRFSGQHAVRELAGNRLLMFDNGVGVRDSSRALELDLSATEARAVWQWRPSRPNLSTAVSSARRLANGHTLVAFGMSAYNGSTGPVEVFEVDRQGQSVWHMEVAGTKHIFRAEPWPSIGSEYSEEERDGGPAGTVSSTRE